MRTTIDLPADLMQVAKVRAAEHGETLKDLFTRAITREVGLSAAGRAGGRVVLPLVGAGADATIHVTNADLEAALADDDAERYAG